MPYRIIKTTDHQHLREVLENLPSIGSEVKVGPSTFEVVGLKRLTKKRFQIITYNYILEVEKI